MLDPATNFGKVVFTTRLAADAVVEKLEQAIRARMPGIGDPSAIPLLCNDRVITPGPGQTNDQVVGMLSNAWKLWKQAGLRRSVLQAVWWALYDPTIVYSSKVPICAIVGGDGTSSTWDTLYSDSDPSSPTHASVSPPNFNWDGLQFGRRCWLILYANALPTGQSGTGASVVSLSAGSFDSPGQNTNGVWVPATSGTPVNYPWMTLGGMSGLTSSNVGQWITISGSSHPKNNGTFPIVSVPNSGSCVIANPAGVVDASALAWSISYYPTIGPAMPWGSPGTTFGEGEISTPSVDTGSLVGGVWRPTTAPSAETSPARSWGLSCPPAKIETVRQALRKWRSATTWYVDIVVAFDGSTGVPGSAFSPNSSQGSGNPDGSFGSPGQNTNGVWVPTHGISSPFDAYCQGIGKWVLCSVPNQI